MLLRRLSFASFVTALVIALFLAPLAAVAQDENGPKVEIFAGYSWYNPGGNHVLLNYQPGGVNPVFGTYKSIPGGWGEATTFRINKYLGVTADFGGHYSDQLHASTFLFGPQLKLMKGEQFSPFFEALFGLERLAPHTTNPNNAFAIAAGGGLDMNLSKRFGWRVLQGDYMYTTYRDKAVVGTSRLDGARVQSGLLLKFGITPPPPATASCSAATPAEVFAGEPVKVTLTPGNFNPKRTLTYSWTSTGGKATGKETAEIDTTGLNPGSYTVTGKVEDNGKGKHQMVATCTSSFAVKERPKHPPVASCSANPTTVQSGTPATITTTASSPDERPLTYQYTATAGRITGSGASVQLDTAGLKAGPVTVNCTASDDRGLTASSSANVNVEVPPPPPTASKLNEIAFPDKKRPARVDNAAKAILDDVALKLQRDADAKAVVIGSADPAELKLKKNKNLAAERAYNTKEYLTKEKGIDPTRIELRTGGEGQKAEIWVVPAGATFDQPNTTVVDEAQFAKPVKKAHKAAKKK